MEQKPFGDELIAEIVEGIEASDKTYELYVYIADVARKCFHLCARGEHLRIFNEYKMLIDNIRKELNL